MNKVVFITLADAEYGFGLAGIAQYTAGAENAGEIIQKIMAEPDTRLIIIDERAINVMSIEIMRDMEKDWGGILLVLPSPTRPPAEVEDYASRLIRRAIGYHVRLQL